MWARKVAALAPRCDLIAPILLSIAAVLLTSLLIRQAYAHLTALHIRHDSEDLALAYILPTILLQWFLAATSGFRLR